MITLPIGNNAIGKTEYLRKILKSYRFDDVITNMRPKEYILNETHNQERLDILSDILISEDIKPAKYQLIINDPCFELSTKFLELMTLLCRNRDIMILDNPDAELTFEEKSVIISFLARTTHTYKQVFIVTHNEKMLCLKAKFYTVEKRDGDFFLKEVSDADAYKVID